MGSSGVLMLFALYTYPGGPVWDLTYARIRSGRIAGEHK